MGRLLEVEGRWAVISSYQIRVASTTLYSLQKMSSWYLKDDTQRIFLF